jgi:hypothetical protein
MSLPPSYTRFALIAAINAYRDHLERAPEADVALRLRRLLVEAEAELAQLTHNQGLTDGVSVDRRAYDVRRQPVPGRPKFIGNRSRPR